MITNIYKNRTKENSQELIDIKRITERALFIYLLLFLTFFLILFFFGGGGGGGGVGHTNEPSNSEGYK